MRNSYRFLSAALALAFCCLLLCACAKNKKGLVPDAEKETHPENENGTAVTDIEIATYPFTTEFFVGERFEKEGLTLKVTYANGKKETVSEGFTCTVDPFDKSGYYPVTVAYGEKTLNYTVTVASEGLAFELMEGECVLRGIGDCSDTDIIIPSRYEGEKVTMIGGYAFEDNTTIRSVVLPEGVLSIADYAFVGCTALESVKLPDSLETLTGGCFRGCTALKDVKLPIYLQKIGSFTFASCPQLSYLVIPKSVVTMGRHVFADNDNLSYVYCEAQSKPNGWDSAWNGSSAMEKWGIEWQYTNGMPILK